MEYESLGVATHVFFFFHSVDWWIDCLLAAPRCVFFLVAMSVCLSLRLSVCLFVVVGFDWCM